MKVLPIMAALGLSLAGLAAPVAAQPYYGRDDGYRDRDYRPRERDYGPRDRDYESEDRGPRYRGRAEYGFDEGEYLRCNPDVRRAVRSGQMESGAAHWRTFGRREGRRLSC